MDLSPLRQLRKGRLPQMVSWYDPRLLARVGIRTMVSSVFGQYADQRLMQAVTDRCDDAELCGRYDYSDPRARDPQRRIAMDEGGAFWVDYVADVGDGFEPTYTAAYLLAQDSLDVKGAGTLRHGEILIMGGDQCYPQATREEYKHRLLQPFNWAFSVAHPDRKLFAIPGNHDWYDGLNAFDGLFCSSRDRLSAAKGHVIGGWQCQQHRSYWAIRLPHNWWMWGADIQFSKYLDTPQVSYFETMADQLQPGDSLIICLAQPSWMIADLQGLDEEENFFKITSIARARGAHIVAVIAGDWHHYNRYYAHELDVHFITSGGGGAFLHPTHVLKNNVQVRWPERPEDAGSPIADAAGARPGDPWRAREVNIRLKRNTKAAENVVEQAVQDVQDALEPLQPEALKGRKRPLQPQAPKCYPTKTRSYLMSLRNVLFPFYNPAFAIGIGLLYWLITWEFQTLVTRHAISSGKIDDLGIGTSAPQRAAVRAALSGSGHGRLDHAGRDAGRPLCGARLVRGCDRAAGPAPLCHQIPRRHRALRGARGGHVHPVADGGEPQQPDGAGNRAAAAGHQRDARRSSRPWCARSSANPSSRCSASRRPAARSARRCASWSASCPIPR